MRGAVKRIYGSVMVAVVCAACTGPPPKGVPPGWEIQEVGTAVSLRGVSAVNDQIAWISGAEGTVGRTTDGGKTWNMQQVPGAEALDFRDIEAPDADTAFILSIGSGDSSRIYMTRDGGTSWHLQFKNELPEGFLDAIDFWDSDHGISMGDPIDGKYLILTTDDAGTTWVRVDPDKIPIALEGEAAFAASGTCLVVQGKHHAWIGTGGGPSARVFRSFDRGQTWVVAETPIVAGNSSSGIFSLIFFDALRGIAVGGDYRRPDEAETNIAVTADGGRTWTALDIPHMRKYLSGIAVSGDMQHLVAVGTNFSGYSHDGGETWKVMEGDGYNAVSLSPAGSSGWAVGSSGRVARLRR